MISNQVLQNTLEGLKEISRTEFCVLDTEGKVLASTFADFSIATQDVQAFVESQADSQLVKGFQYFKVCDDYQLEYILVAHGDDEDTYMVGKLAAFQIQNLIVAYKERFDKDSFIKNLLLDNLLLVDIYNRAKKLHIEADVRRVVMILEMIGMTAEIGAVSGDDLFVQTCRCRNGLERGTRTVQTVCGTVDQRRVFRIENGFIVHLIVFQIIGGSSYHAQHAGSFCVQHYDCPAGNLFQPQLFGFGIP